MRRSISMTAWAALLASLLLLQDYGSTSTSTLGVNARVIQQGRPSQTDRRLSAAAAAVEAVQPYNNAYEGFSRRKRQLDSLDGPSDSIVLNLQGIAEDILAPPSTSASTSTLPWCSDLSSLSISSYSTSTSSIPDSRLSTSSSVATSSVVTSSSAGEAICIALPTFSTASSSSTTSSTSSSTRNSVQTIIVAPSAETQSNARPRSTRTVTAVQTLQRQIAPTPSTTVIVEVTSTVFVLSTTIHLNTVYTTITPRPTAAFVTS